MEAHQQFVDWLTARYQWMFEGSGQLRVWTPEIFAEDNRPVFYDLALVIGHSPVCGDDEAVREIVRKTRRFSVLDAHRFQCSPHELIFKLEKRGWVVDYLESSLAVDQIKLTNCYPNGVLVCRPVHR